jgi:type I restriction enzyme S subunit
MHIPEGWSNLQISEILERVSDAVLPEPEENYYQIGIRSHGKGIFHKKPVTGESLGNKRVFRVHPDCFVVNIVFAWEQAIAKTSISEVGRIASHRFPMFRPKNNLCDVDYLTYLFKSPKGKYLLGLASPGGAGRNKTLGQNEFSLLRITLPPTKEQQKIAQILSTWDKAIETLEALITAKEKRKKALMQQLLTGKRRFQGFSGKWKWVRFDQILDIEIGGTPSRNNPDYWDKEKVSRNRWLSIRDLKGNVIQDTKEYITDLGVKKSNVTLIPAGSIVMSFKLTIGRAAILGKDCYTNEAICSLIPKDLNTVTTEFLIQALDIVDFEQEIDQAIKGKTLNKAKLKRLKINLPLVDEQQKIAVALAAADKEIIANQNQLAALKQQKKALMQQLLTGKKRVNVTQVVA